MESAVATSTTVPVDQEHAARDAAGRRRPPRGGGRGRSRRARAIATAIGRLAIAHARAAGDPEPARPRHAPAVGGTRAPSRARGTTRPATRPSCRSTGRRQPAGRTAPAAGGRAVREAATRPRAFLAAADEPEDDHDEPGDGRAPNRSTIRAANALGRAASAGRLELGLRHAGRRLRQSGAFGSGAASDGAGGPGPGGRAPARAPPSAAGSSRGHRDRRGVLRLREARRREADREEQRARSSATTPREDATPVMLGPNALRHGAVDRARGRSAPPSACGPRGTRCDRRGTRRASHAPCGRGRGPSRWRC